MARQVSIQLKGKTLLIKNLKGLPSKIRGGILDAAYDEFTIAANNAKTIALPYSYTGDLVQKISTVREGDKIIYQSLSDHAAYAEFGIRGSVRPTREFGNIARSFQGKGIPSSLTPKEAIYKWAAFRNIDKQFWYPIFQKIMGNPLKGGRTGFEPIANGEGYFFRPYIVAKTQLLKKANEIVKKFVK